MSVAVVILNWNGQQYLEQFLPSVVKHSKGASIYVADNASTDDSIAFVKENFPGIKLVINEENGGFAKGYNDALKAIATSDPHQYYVLLNSDIEVTSNWIHPIIELMQQDDTIAAVQPKVLAYHRKTHFEHAGASGGFLDHHGYPFCRGRLFEEAEVDEGQYDDVHEVFWATGACMFIRAELYHQFGGLDEDFFAHMEEIDLCWRLKNAGHKIMACPQSHVYHVGGGTLSYQSPRKTYLNFRNNLFMLTKNYRRGNLLVKIWWRLVLDGIAGIKFLFEGNFKHLIAVIKAHFHFYGKLGTMLQRRKALASSLNNSNYNGVYQRSIVWDFFVNKCKKFSDLKQELFID